MKLNLVNWAMVILEPKGDHGMFGSDVEISPDKVTWSDGEDEVAKKLLVEIFGGKSGQMKIELWKGEENNLILKLKDGESGPVKILKNLWNRFYDNVTVTVDLSAVNEAMSIPSTGKMAIKKTSSFFGCVGSIQLNVRGHGSALVSKVAKTWLKVTVDILLPNDRLLSTGHVHASKMILEKGFCSDLNISAKDGVLVPAHKAFLSACSPVLEAQFTGGSQLSQDMLDLSDVSEVGVKAFLRYVYYQDLEEAERDSKIALELFSIAHKFEIIALEMWTTANLIELMDMNVEKAYSVYSVVKKMTGSTVDKLKRNAANILRKNFPEMESLSQYQELLMKNADSALELCTELIHTVGGGAD